MKAVVIAVVLCFCGASLAQVSSEEALAKLKAKQEARDSARSKPVTITQGELDDMKAELARLRVENAQLKASHAAAATPVVRTPTSIAVGMTRDELMKYVSLHKDRYQLVSANPTAPVAAAVPGAPPIPTSEVIKLSVKEMKEVIVGVSSNGVNKFADTHKELRPSSTLTLNLTDNKVSSINEEKLPPASDEATPENVKRAVAGISTSSGRRGR